MVNPRSLPDPVGFVNLGLLSDGTIVLESDSGVAICVTAKLARSLGEKLTALATQAAQLEAEDRLNSGARSGLLN